MANTTWNPSDLINVTLSSLNLKATTSTASAGVRAVNSKNAGKYYFEITYTTVNTNTFTSGLSLSSASLPAPAAGALTVSRSSGNISVNNVSSGSSLGIIAPGSVVGIAVDITGKLAWLRIAPSGNWNGSGTANPATGTGGVNITSISTGPLFPLFAGASADAATANFGDSAFSGAVPSGFTAGWPATAPIDLAGAFAPSVAFQSTVGLLVGLAGNLGSASHYGRFHYGRGHFSRGGPFAPTFAADLDVRASVVLSGGLSPQISLGGALTVLFAPTGISGNLSLNVVLGASSFDVGPLWATVSPIPPPWTPSELCPPPPWMTTPPCEPVVWSKSRLCNG